MKPDRRLIFLMTVGYRRLQRGLEQEMLAQDGLTSAQSGVLFFLGQNDGALIGDVASALDLVPSATTGLADRMERAGLKNCSVRQGDLYDLPLANDSFDVVILHQVLHFLDDGARAGELVGTLTFPRPSR